MHACPAGAYFSMKKSRQKSLGECPETPDASVHPARKAKGRLPGAGLDDAYKVPQAHFMWGLLQTNSRKSCCRAYELNKQLFAQTAPPPLRGRGTGWGQIRRGYLWSASVRSTDLFFPIIEGKTIFVSSTAKRQRGLARGNSSPLTRFFLLLAVQKEAPAG